jgi:hypothetical protein
VLALFAKLLCIRFNASSETRIFLVPPVLVVIVALKVGSFLATANCEIGFPCTPITEASLKI